MLDLADIQAAATRIAGQVLDTPCLESRTLSEITGAQVFLKFVFGHELFQPPYGFFEGFEA